MGGHPTHGSMHSYVESEHASRSLQFRLVSSWHPPLLWCYTWHPCQVWQHAIQWLILLCSIFTQCIARFLLINKSPIVATYHDTAVIFEKKNLKQLEQKKIELHLKFLENIFCEVFHGAGGDTWRWIWYHQQLYVPHGCLVVGILVPDSVPVPSMQISHKLHFPKFPNDIQIKRKLP